MLYLNACFMQLGVQIRAHLKVVRNAYCTLAYVAKPSFAKKILKQVKWAHHFGVTPVIDLLFSVSHHVSIVLCHHLYRICHVCTIMDLWCKLLLSSSPSATSATLEDSWPCAERCIWCFCHVSQRFNPTAFSAFCKNMQNMQTHHELNAYIAHPPLIEYTQAPTTIGGESKTFNLTWWELLWLGSPTFR